jgi:predicted nucleic acid-binding protein
MAAKTEAYVDTSALIAFADRSDASHSLFARLFGDPPPLFTSPFVIVEGHAWFLRRYDRSRALQFLAMTDEMACLRVARIQPDQMKSAQAVLRRFGDQDLTLVDAMGLVLMRDRGTASCWSTDRHLALMGVPLVIHDS